MAGLGFALVAIGVADLISGGLSGTPGSLRSAVAGVAVGMGAMVAYLASTTTSLHVWVYAIGTVVGVLAWQLVRLGDLSDQRAGTAAAVFGVLAAALLIGAPSAESRWTGGLESFLAANPSALVAETPPSRVVLLMGIFLVLAAPANGVVRMVLRASGTRLEASETTLRGGRLIGVLERWLIFSLSVAGAPTAAAIVASAKSLVRFPELADTRANGQRAEGDAREIDYVTEYFLLGSLLSWSCAVAAVFLFG